MYVAIFLMGCTTAETADHNPDDTDVIHSDLSACKIGEVCTFRGAYDLKFENFPGTYATFNIGETCVVFATSAELQYDLVELAWFFSDEQAALRNGSSVVAILRGEAVARRDFRVVKNNENETTMGVYRDYKIDMSDCSDLPYILIGKRADPIIMH